jgi:endonuclease/exonuclease/phosphatase (EEP) superfamily protein YafD
MVLAVTTERKLESSVLFSSESERPRFTCSELILIRRYSGHTFVCSLWIFYLLLLSHSKLSETPFKPSQHKSAANIRICTAIRLLLHPGTSDEQQFVVLNTHLDHQSDLARRFGASLMLHRARHEAAKFGPVLVFGDFNRHAVSSSLMK